MVSWRAHMSGACVAPRPMRRPLALLGLVRAATVRGEPAAEHADEALKLFGDLGLARYTQRVRDLAAA